MLKRPKRKTSNICFRIEPAVKEAYYAALEENEQDLTSHLTSVIVAYIESNKRKKKTAR